MRRKAVWKFLLNVGRGVTTGVNVSANHRVLSVGYDPQGRPSVWVEIELTADGKPESPTPKVFTLLYTGDSAPVCANWVGMVTVGALVYHCYTEWG